MILFRKALGHMTICLVPVMEAFHHFAEHRPARTMEFIWFGSEEKGLVGSQNYVKSHEGEMSRHVFNLNVDLAGAAPGRKRSGCNCRSDRLQN